MIASPYNVLVSLLREHQDDRSQQRLIGDDQREQQEHEQRFFAW